MKGKIYFTIVLAALFFYAGDIVSQVSMEKVTKPLSFDVSPKLSDITPIPPAYVDRTWKEKVIPNKDGFLEEFNTPSTWQGPDPALQDDITGSRSSATIDQNFSGNYNQSGVAPPDTDGDVGLNHYFQMVNSLLLFH